MLHRRVLDRRHVVPLIRIIWPPKVRFRISGINDADGHFPRRRRRREAAAAIGSKGAAAAAATGRECETRQRGRLIRFIVAPDLAEVSVDEVDAPAGLLPDAVKDGEDFVLLGAGGEAGNDGVEGAESDGGDAAVFDVGDDAAEFAGVLELEGGVFLLDLGRGGGEGVGFAEEGDAGVVEHSGDNGGAFDEPGCIRGVLPMNECRELLTRFRGREIWKTFGRDSDGRAASSFEAHSPPKRPAIPSIASNHCIVPQNHD